MQFGLMFFASSRQYSVAEAYELVRRATQFADEHGFCCVWTPERHFHDFGGLFPNPSVLSAALAVQTHQLQIRAGSLISPLHNTIRIAEDWAILDNLSGGRVGISFGSGWNIDDFVLFPDRYSSRRTIMYDQIDLIQKLWAGEPVTESNSNGTAVEISISPKPVQRKLPIWITSSASTETFERAGQIGANLLTHLLAQDLGVLSSKIEAYHRARRQSEADGEGVVTLMLHTFLGTDMEEVRQKVAEPLREYLRSAISLEKKAARGGGTISCGYKLPADNLTGDGLEELVDIAFERYFHRASLMGTLEKCSDFVTCLEEIGVNEIACLIDFGVDVSSVLDSLEVLNKLRERFAEGDRSQVDSLVRAFTATLED